MRRIVIPNPWSNQPFNRPGSRAPRPARNGATSATPGCPVRGTVPVQCVIGGEIGIDRHPDDPPTRRTVGHARPVDPVAPHQLVGYP